MNIYIQKLKQFHHNYEKLIPVAFFALGAIFDIVTIGRIDDIINILFQSLYLAILLSLLILEFKKVDQLHFKFSYINQAYQYRKDIAHFCLGALLSAFTIFYFKSSSFANSFLFLFLMVALLFINELEVTKDLGSIIRSILLKLCLVSFFIYIIPIIIGKTSWWIFFLSTFVSLVVTFSVYRYLKKHKVSDEILRKEILLPHLIVVVFFWALYLFKVIPPVPLAVTEIGIYHDIKKTQDSYDLYYTKPWWRFYHNSDVYFEARPNDKVFVFLKVFSPGGFKDRVYLRWMKEIDGDMKTSDRIPLEIVGGREDGFRGYAYKANHTEGDWQIRVETKSGLEIGRINFEIVNMSKDKERILYRKEGN